ncbi:MAG: hypothetical protein AB2795_10260, partial [Candidatus Thiodiazotropha endolucinida]
KGASAPFFYGFSEEFVGRLHCFRHSGADRNPGRWYQKHETMESAIEREIAIKSRKLAWKFKKRLKR